MNAGEQAQKEAAALTHHAQRVAVSVARQSIAPTVSFPDIVQIVRAAMIETHFIALAACTGALYEMGATLGLTEHDRVMSRAKEAFERASGRTLESMR